MKRFDENNDQFTSVEKVNNILMKRKGKVTETSDNLVSQNKKIFQLQKPSSFSLEIMSCFCFKKITNAYWLNKRLPPSDISQSGN